MITSPNAPPEMPPYEAVIAELCRRDFKTFAHQSWPSLKTGNPLIAGKYFDAICDHLQAVHDGKIMRLVINLLARSLKSTLASVLYPAWVWLQRPETRFLSASYEQLLSERDSWASRSLLNTDWYKNLNLTREGKPIFSLLDDQNQKGFYTNDQGGRRFATHVGGGTGHGGHVLLIDDPLSIDQSHSDIETQLANQWLFETLWTRQDDPQNTRIIIVQHRLREDDPSGEALKRGLGFDHLCLPLEYSSKRFFPPTAIGWSDWRTEEGESLCPERWNAKTIAEYRAAHPTLFEAIDNQDPVAAGEKPIKPEWIQRWSSTAVEEPGATLPDAFDRVALTWDTSFKGMDRAKKKTKRSKTAGQAWGFKGSNAYLLANICRHMSFVEQQAAIKSMRADYPGAAIYVEDAANGSALLASLSQTIPGMIGIVPKDSKYLRVVAVTRFFAAGNVWFPPDEHAPWVAPLVDRVIKFPSIPFDDEIDAMSQVLTEEMIKLRKAYPMIAISSSTNERPNPWSVA